MEIFAMTLIYTRDLFLSFARPDIDSSGRQALRFVSIRDDHYSRPFAGSIANEDRQ
jgi:hypothetical protein